MSLKLNSHLDNDSIRVPRSVFFLARVETIMENNIKKSARRGAVVIFRIFVKQIKIFVCM